MSIINNPQLQPSDFYMEKSIPVANDLNNRALEDAEKLLIENSIHKNNIKVTWEEESHITVYADQYLLNQVLINLIKNAIEALNENNTTENKEIRLSFFIQEDGKTIINIANNGKPIDKDILPNIFIPFFTTKASGSGIGLSVSRQIIRLHGGKLQHFISSEGMTVFQITI